MSIRPAVPDDAAAIAAVHVASWRTTYRGLLPDEFLAGLEVEPRERMWRSQAERLQSGEQVGTLLVAERPDDGIVGFVSGGPERETDSGIDGELYAIYLLEQFQGQGTGRLLARGLVSEFRHLGFGSMRLWVLRGNPAKRFYERLGGVSENTKREMRGDIELVEVDYIWRELPGAI